MSRIQQQRCGLEALCGWDEVFEHDGFFLQVWPIGLKKNIQLIA